MAFSPCSASVVFPEQVRRNSPEFSYSKKPEDRWLVAVVLIWPQLSGKAMLVT